MVQRRRGSLRQAEPLATCAETWLILQIWAQPLARYQAGISIPTGWTGTSILWSPNCPAFSRWNWHSDARSRRTKAAVAAGLGLGNNLSDSGTDPSGFALREHDEVCIFGSYYVWSYSQYQWHKLDTHLSLRGDWFVSFPLIRKMDFLNVIFQKSLRQDITACHIMTTLIMHFHTLMGHSRTTRNSPYGQ